MGRRKSIDRDSIMAAVEAVVRRQGLAGLSIDAVAREAGISKSSVLYDFKNKAGLLAAFMSNRIAVKRDMMIRAAAAREGQEHPWLLGMLDVLSVAPSEEDIAITMILAAGMGSDECRAPMCSLVQDDLTRVTSGPGDSRQAQLAYLAIQGLLSLEYFGFHRFQPEERARLLADIAGLVASPGGERTDDPDETQNPDQRDMT